MSETLKAMPERIWAEAEPYSFPGYDPAWLWHSEVESQEGLTEYVRADFARPAPSDALREALRPFASEADEWHETVADNYRPLQAEPGCEYCNPGSEASFCIGDLRRAKHLLEAGLTPRETRTPPETLPEIAERHLPWMKDCKGQVLSAGDKVMVFDREYNDFLIPGIVVGPGTGIDRGAIIVDAPGAERRDFSPGYLAKVATSSSGAAEIAERHEAERATGPISVSEAALVLLSSLAAPPANDPQAVDSWRLVNEAMGSDVDAWRRFGAGLAALARQQLEGGFQWASAALASQQPEERENGEGAA